MIRKFLFIIFAIGGSLSNAAYKTGIDAVYGGTEGTDWYSESLYHDPLVWDREVVYIASTTAITLQHNARNIQPENPLVPVGVNGADDVADSGDEGQIRYSIDQDGFFGISWSLPEGGTPEAVAYSTPLVFSALTYPDATSVLGATGHSTGNTQNRENVADYYRGHLDSVGDEWHVISVADDDSWAYGTVTSDGWDTATDGKLYHFVVDPKTPCIRISKSGDAQFYTTPPKAYRVPKICDQISYIDAGTGDLDIELRAIGGQNISYRIVSDPADAVTAYTAAGAASVILDDSDFSGTLYLQYYYAGNAAYVKTRKVVSVSRSVAADFPSYSEGHGNFLWADAEEFASILSRFDDPSDGNLYLSYRRNVEDEGRHGQANWDTYGGQGLRIGKRLFGGQSAFTNAFVALVEGWTESELSLTGSGSSKPYAAYAKEMALENIRTIDPLGFELYHKGGEGIPSNEQNYIGYYDVGPVWDLLYGYDLLVAHYRSDQYSGGVTPVEDYYLRDRLGSFAAESATILGYWMYFYRPEMWGSARTITALLIAICMPSYDSEVYGVSGFDGTATGYYDTPFPDYNWTWKTTFADTAVAAADGLSWPASTYPNPFSGLGVEQAGVGGYGLISESAEWGDKTSYFSEGLMGSVYTALLNITARQTTIDFPDLETAILHAVSGTLTSFKYSDPASPYHGPTYVGLDEMVNDYFPDVVDAHLSTSLSNVTSAESLTTLLWFDPLASGSPVGPDASPVLFTDGSGRMKITHGSSGGMRLSFNGPIQVPSFGGPTVEALPASGSTTLSVGSATEDHYHRSLTAFEFSGSYTFNTAWADDSPVVEFLDGNGARQIKLRLQADGDLELLEPNGDTISFTANQPISADTAYTIAVTGTRGTGANASITVSLNGSPVITTTTGEWVNQIEILRFQENASGTVTIGSYSQASAE